MDNNTLEALKRLADLAESFNGSEDFNGRDAVLDIIADLMDKVQLKPTT